MTVISNGEAGLSVREKLNKIWEALELNDIDASIADTAVDVFVYDTSKDSDGGAWRRGGDHPAVAVAILTATALKIINADDPSAPTFKTESYTGLSLKSVRALNGK